jgi:hypothetical protein
MSLGIGLGSTGLSAEPGVAIVVRNEKSDPNNTDQEFASTLATMAWNSCDRKVKNVCEF